MLNQLSGLSSPPLSFTPLTIISSSHLEDDLGALRAAAPNAVVRGGERRSLSRRNTVIVLDRCGRLVYQQTLQQSDTNLQSVEAAILSAHLDDPCGPCHQMPSQEEQPSHGGLDRVHDKFTSQAKMSSIANAYASSNVANSPTDARQNKAVVEETPDDRRDDDAEGESVPETTRKPERKKKNKNKRKKGNVEKRKNRKRVEEEALTSTLKPTYTVDTIATEECECDTGREDATRDCECPGQSVVEATDDDVIGKLISLSEVVNEILSSRDIVDAQTTDSPFWSRPPGRFVPYSEVKWAGEDLSADGKEKTQKNRPRAEEEETSTSKPAEIVSNEECECDTAQDDARRDCECAGQSVVDATNDDAIGKLISLSEVANEIVDTVQTTKSTTAASFQSQTPRRFPLYSEIKWPGDEQHANKNAKKTQKKNGKQNRTDLEREVDEVIEIIKEEEELYDCPMIKFEPNELYRRRNCTRSTDNFDDGDNKLTEIEKAVSDGHLFGREEGYQGAENGLSSEDGGVASAMNNERDGEGLITDDLPAGDDEVVVPDRSTDPSQRGVEEAADSDNVWGTYRRDESKDVGKKKKEETFKDVSKKGKMNSKVKEGKYKRAEKDREEEGDDWVGSDESDSQEYVLRWPTGETDGGRVAGREPESTPRYVTWLEVTVAPTEHDPRSSGDSEDQTRRVVVYESEGQDSASDKVEQLHSKVKPWTKGKRY